MKLIGVTSSGTRLVELTAQELSALMAAANTLGTLAISYMTNDTPAAEETPASNPAPVRRKRREKKAKPGERLCLHCKEPLPAGAHHLMRVHKKCKQAHARTIYFAKHQQPAATPPNHASPGLTDKERKEAAELKAKRLEMIARIARKTAEE